MRSILAGLATACLLVMPAAAAGFAATYDVAGSSPGGGGDYTGVVTISQTGEATYQVVWLIGGQKFVGTGIGSPKGLAVGYRSGESTGIAIYRMGDDGKIDGYWTYAGGKQVGQERWSPNP